LGPRMFTGGKRGISSMFEVIAPEQGADNPRNRACDYRALADEASARASASTLVRIVGMR
jgi:hypothetical protein